VRQLALSRAARRKNTAPPTAGGAQRQTYRHRLFGQHQLVSAADRPSAIMKHRPAVDARGYDCGLETPDRIRQGGMKVPSSSWAATGE